MRLLPISKATLDTFRKDVYRPRLALLLLLILLSGRGAEQLGASRGSGSHAEQSAAALQIGQAEHKSARSGLTAILSTAPSTAASPACSPSNKHFLSSFFDFIPFPPVDEPAPDSHSQDRPASSSPASTSTQGNESARQPAPGSVFRLPKPSLTLLLDPDVLPVLVPLHVLWIVRLMGMALEDRLVSSPAIKLTGARRLWQVAQIILLALIAVAASTTTVAERLRLWTMEQLSDGDSAQRTTNSPLLPLHALVLLELSTTLLSLLSPLTKISPPLLPASLTLPSPSHAPPFSELLYLPRPIFDALTGRIDTTRASRGQLRRPAFAGGLRRHGALPGPVEASPARVAGTGGPGAPAIVGRAAIPGGQSARNLRALESPLRLPDEHAQPSESSSANSQGSAQTRRRAGKAPRLKGQEVQIEMGWFVEVVVALWGRIVGSLQYAIVTLSLPTLSPTTLPPVLSLLSLRAELGAVANTWTSARRTVECLEFVRRRWGVYEEHSVPANANLNANANAAREGLGSSSSTGTSSNATSTAPPPSRRPNVEPRWKPSDSSELVCAICFEGVNTNPNTKTDSSADPVDQSAQNPSPNPNPTRETMRGRCRLDCGHELHATCLVAWLHHQAFCPTCHLALSASPPAAPAARPSVVTSPAPASPVSGMHGRTETLRRRAGSVTTASASANATAITAAAVTEDEGEGEDERGVPSYIF